MYLYVSRHRTLCIMLYDTLSSFSSFQMALLFLVFSNISTITCLSGTAFAYSALSCIIILSKSSSQSKPFSVMLMFSSLLLVFWNPIFHNSLLLIFHFSCNAYNFGFSGILSCIVGSGNKTK